MPGRIFSKNYRKEIKKHKKLSRLAQKTIEILKKNRYRFLLQAAALPLNTTQPAAAGGAAVSIAGAELVDLRSAEDDALLAEGNKAALGPWHAVHAEYTLMYLVLLALILLTAYCCPLELRCIRKQPTAAYTEDNGIRRPSAVAADKRPQADEAIRFVARPAPSVTAATRSASQPSFV